MLPELKVYYKAPGIKTVSYWHKNRCIDQWNRIDSPEMNPHLDRQLIYDKGGKNIQWGKDSLFNKWYWKNWTATYKIIKLDYSLTTGTKINSKWIQDLSGRPETTKRLKENIGSKLFVISTSNFFQICLFQTIPLLGINPK